MGGISGTRAQGDAIMSAPEWPWSREMRPMLQAEAAECGLACLAMVAAHHGQRVNTDAALFHAAEN